MEEDDKRTLYDVQGSEELAESIIQDFTRLIEALREVPAPKQMTEDDLARMAQICHDCVKSCETAQRAMHVRRGNDDTIRRRETKLKDIPLPSFGIMGRRGWQPYRCRYLERMTLEKKRIMFGQLWLDLLDEYVEDLL